jgi:hypothetical protein
MANTYTLVLEEQMLNIVASALSELPFKVAQPVIAELQSQILSQNKPAAPVPTEST